jgi:hypothetical protein
MRQIIEVEQITCNNCGREITKEQDLHVVTLKIDDTDYDTDWCSPCHHKLMNSVTTNGANALACGYPDCEFVAKTEGGLRTHRTRMNHPRTRRAQLG